MALQRKKDPTEYCDGRHQQHQHSYIEIPDERTVRPRQGCPTHGALPSSGSAEQKNSSSRAGNKQNAQHVRT